MQATAQAFTVLNHPSLDNLGRGTVVSAHSTPATTLVESADLLKGHKTVGILHNGSLYRLQATKLGKLILTK